MGIPIKYEALIENFDRCLKFFEDLETKAEEAKARKNAKGNGKKKENKLNQIDLEQFKDDFKYIDKLYGSGINNPGLSLAITNFEPEKKEKWLREFISKLAILGTEKDKGSVGNVEMRNRISRKINSLKKELKEVLDKIQKLVDEGNVPFPLKSDKFKADLKMCIEKVDFYYDETVENKAKKDDKTDEEARKAIEDDAKGIIPYKESSIAEGIRMIQSKDSGDFKGKMRYLIDEINKEGSYRGISLLDGKDAEGNNKCKNISLLKKILVNHTLGHFGLDDDKVQDAVDNLDYAIKMKKNAEGSKAYKAKLEDRKAKRKIAREEAERKKKEQEAAAAAKEEEERKKKEQEERERKEKEKKEQAERKKKEQEAAEAAAAARKAEEEKLRAAKEKEEKEKEKREQEAAERKRKEEEEKKEREKKEQESAEAERKRKEAEAAILGAILSISGNEVPSSLGGISGGAICKALEKGTYTSENFINTLCECKDELRQNRNSENNESEFLYDALLCIESEKDEKRKEGVEIIYDEKKLEELKSILEPAGEKQTPQAAEEKEKAAVPAGKPAVEKQSPPQAVTKEQKATTLQSDENAKMQGIKKDFEQLYKCAGSIENRFGECQIAKMRDALKKITEAKDPDGLVQAVYDLADFTGMKWLYNQVQPLEEKTLENGNSSIDEINKNLNMVKVGFKNSKNKIKDKNAAIIDEKTVNEKIEGAITTLNGIKDKVEKKIERKNNKKANNPSTNTNTNQKPADSNNADQSKQQLATTNTAASSAKQQAKPEQATNIAASAKTDQSEQQPTAANAKPTEPGTAAKPQVKPNEEHAGNLDSICLTLQATLKGQKGVVDNQQYKDLIAAVEAIQGSYTSGNIGEVIEKIKKLVEAAKAAKGIQIELNAVENLINLCRQLYDNAIVQSNEQRELEKAIQSLEEYKRLKEVDKIKFNENVTENEIRKKLDELNTIIAEMTKMKEDLANEIKKQNKSK